MSVLFWDDTDYPDHLLPRRQPNPYFYRTFHESPITANQYTIDDDLLENNVFQALEEFQRVRDLTRSRILRHLNWYDAQEPFSSYISAFGSQDAAKKRAARHHEHQTTVYRKVRICVAKIRTSGLEPAVLCSPHQARPIIPIWVDRSQIPDEQSSVTWKFLKSWGVDIWISLCEARSCLGIPREKGQNDEWLACGKISTQAIEDIMPYNDCGLHERPTLSRVKSTCGNWEFDWSELKWVSKDYARSKRHQDVKRREQSRKALCAILDEAEADIVAYQATLAGHIGKLDLAYCHPSLKSRLRGYRTFLEMERSSNADGTHQLSRMRGPFSISNRSHPANLEQSQEDLVFATAGLAIFKSA